MKNAKLIWIGRTTRKEEYCMLSTLIEGYADDCPFSPNEEKIPDVWDIENMKIIPLYETENDT